MTHTREYNHSGANINVIHAIRAVLRHDFRHARTTDDLHRRLAHKGYQICDDHLATLPHGKIICPMRLIA